MIFCDNNIGITGMDKFIIDGTKEESPSGTRNAAHCCFLHSYMSGKGFHNLQESTKFFN